MIITIDGPAASGKSTVAQRVAQALGYHYLNTGLLYRAVAYLLTCRFNYTALQLMQPSVQHLNLLLDEQKLKYCYQNGQAEIWYDGANLTGYLKNAQIDQLASQVSAAPVVRQALLTFQRHFTEQYDIVADGRDCGTVVFPQANLKIFLTAKIPVRVRRWAQSMADSGIYLDEAEIQRELQIRDERDQQRAVAPLIKSDDAVVIDTTNLSIDEVVTQILQLLPQ